MPTVWGMPARSSKRPRDANQLAKLLVDLATGEDSVDPANAVEHQKNPAAVALGKLGGKKGGKARATRLSPERRQEISRKAAEARWSLRSRDNDGKR
jgi:hypothetical protein